MNDRVVETSSTTYKRDGLGVLSSLIAHDGVPPLDARHKCAQCDALDPRGPKVQEKDNDAVLNMRSLLHG